MRRYQPESPETYWYEIVEVLYGKDGLPMMWNELSIPSISHVDIDIIESSDKDFDLQEFVKEGLLEQYTQLMRDVDAKAPMMDEMDFEDNGVYADHPEAIELRKVAEVLASGDEEEIAKLNLEQWEDEEDDDEDEQH